MSNFLATTLPHTSMNTLNLIAEAFSYPFFVRALYVGGIISVAGAMLGIYVVLRRESLMGHTIADISFLGIAIGLALGMNLDLITTLVAALAAIAIAILQNTGRFSSDSVLAFTAEVSLAVAIFIISRLHGYRVDLLQYLFGDILGISSSDVVVSLALIPAILIILFFARKKLLQVTFNQELAISAGTNVPLYNTLFTMLVALTIAVGIKIIGIILIAAFLIIPANIAKVFARSFRETAILAVLSAILATTMGLIVSYVLDIPSGAMIVMSLGGMLLLAMGIKGLFCR
ncbi:MAG: metal ABC transporter permease [Actinomycetota bacterium]|nr:metal ABC transporter permease [Actinomycetota bacterium]